jgi:hypothetical protein
VSARPGDQRKKFRRSVPSATVLALGQACVGFASRRETFFDLIDPENARRDGLGEVQRFPQVLFRLA